MRKLVAIGAASAALVVSMVAPSVAGTRTVGVKDDFYSPRSLTVSRNTTVRWKWSADGRHNVVVLRGPLKFRSKLVRSGSYSKKLTRRGTYRIVCTVHSEMTMSVRVR